MLVPTFRNPLRSTGGQQKSFFLPAPILKNQTKWKTDSNFKIDPQGSKQWTARKREVLKRCRDFLFQYLQQLMTATEVGGWLRTRQQAAQLETRLAQRESDTVGRTTLRVSTSA